MKNILIIIFTVLTTSITFAQKIQKKNVPAPVKSALQMNFPQAKAEKWEKEGDNFEAEFKLNKLEQSVLITAQGNIIETEIEIALSQLPKGVLEYVKNIYKGQSIKEAAKITDAQGTVTYEAEIKGMDLLFDTNGIFIREIKNKNQ